MTNPTADTTAAAESWMRSQRDLHFLLEEALQHPEIADALDEEDIPLDEARATILEDPTILARLRAARDLAGALRTTRAKATGWGLASNRMTRSRPVSRIAVAAAAVVVYLVMLVASWSAMPWWLDLFCLVGLVATAGVAAGLGGEDAWTVVSTARNARDQATWRRSVLDEIVLPELRQFIDDRRTPSYGTTLTLRGLHNLYQDDDEAPIIITAAGQRLRRILERSTSDAVAIAGHRGVGKTTAIRAAARGLFSDPGAAPPMQVIASAPSRYEARDFVLHLHAMLARQVIELTGRRLGKTPPPEHEQAPNPRGHVERVLRWLIRKLVVPALLAGIAFLLWDKPYQQFLADLADHVTMTLADFPAHVPDVLNPPDGTSNQMLALPLLILAVLPLTWTVVGLAVSLPFRLLDIAIDTTPTGDKKDLAELHAAAFHQLDRIRFLQTYTSGWSGKIGIPLGSSDVGWARGAQRAEQQLTHPEVVEKFREFAGWATSVLTRQGAIERMVIAIDELDKIAQPDKAHEFINDVKGIFGIEGCLFLVAVSDDAISAFERRGIPVRDAFDSAFSEMVRMDTFTLAESRRWMGRRLVGVPEPFSHLCHCLSGGLPRDLRRSTIDMIDAVRETGSTDLASVTAAMVGRELDRKAHAFAAAARQLDDGPELTAHLTDLLMITRTGATGELVALSARLVPPADSAMPRVRWQSACFVLFCATVIEVFTNDLAEADLDKGVALLGTARAQLSIDPHVAWEVVREVRTTYGLADPSPVRDPAAPRGSAAPRRDPA